MKPFLPLILLISLSCKAQDTARTCYDTIYREIDTHYLSLSLDQGRKAAYDKSMMDQDDWIRKNLHKECKVLISHGQYGDAEVGVVIPHKCPPQPKKRKRVNTSGIRIDEKAIRFRIILDSIIHNLAQHQTPDTVKSGKDSSGHYWCQLTVLLGAVADLHHPINRYLDSNAINLIAADDTIQLGDLYIAKVKPRGHNAPWYSGDHWWKWIGFWIGCITISFILGGLFYYLISRNSSFDYMEERMQRNAGAREIYKQLMNENKA